MSNETPTPPQAGRHSPDPEPRRRNPVVIPALGLAVIGLLWLTRDPLRDLVRHRVTLANDAPPPGQVVEMITGASDPRSALLDAWNSGKIVHRAAAMASVLNVFPGGTNLPPAIESMVLDGTRDPDTNVREAALATLARPGHPALIPRALEQLADPDPMVRRLGLGHLRTAPPALAMEPVVRLLDDPDPAVVGNTLKLIERWTGQRFGSQLADTVQVDDPATGLQVFQPAGIARIHEAADLARRWWLAHGAEYPRPDAPTESAAIPAIGRVVAPDFALPDLDGRIVRLSDLRGKVVLINFWTTWCTACIGEMPVLKELRNRHGDRIAILGVSLDYVPDSHGHIGGHAEVEEQGHSEGHHDDHEATGEALRRVREKVVRVARKRGINYTVLLDEHNEAGGRYNGGELPTTVLVDAQGFMRRRFIGARSLTAFEALIAEASVPVGTPLRAE